MIRPNNHICARLRPKKHLCARRRCSFRPRAFQKRPNKHIHKLTKSFRRLKKRICPLSMVAQAKILMCIAISFSFLIVILVHWPWAEPPSLPPIILEPPTIDIKLPWVAFGGYVGYPFYYIKKGIIRDEEQIAKLVTVTTFCDIDLLYEARRIALNYRGGPMSLSVFIDEDLSVYNTLNTKYTEDYIKHLLDKEFLNIENKYDITIALLYINQSTELYQRKGFLDKTPLAFRLPMNPLRNLAEYQVITQWTLNIDIDFWYLSNTLNDDVHSYLDEMMDITSVYGDKSVFIVPSFEVLDFNKAIYSSLNKQRLLKLISSMDIVPFHFEVENDELIPKDSQQCTMYPDWYKSEVNYKINYQESNCSLYYEPWYIIKTNISRNMRYEWNNEFIGRGYSKTMRVNTLRHYCFNFFAMKDLFMIHAAHTKHIKHNQTLRNYWTKKNRDLLIRERRLLYRNSKTCLTPPIAVKATYYLRSMVFGFAQIIWDYFMNYHLM